MSVAPVSADRPSTPRLHWPVVAVAAAFALLVVFTLTAISLFGLDKAAPRPEAAVAVVSQPAPKPPTPVIRPSQPAPVATAKPVTLLVHRAPQPQPAVPPPPTFKRIQRQSAEELRKQLVQMPEVGLDADARQVIFSIAKGARDVSKHPTLTVIGNREELGDLPLLRGADCQIGKEAAATMQVQSRKLRVTLSRLVRPDETGDTRVRVAELRSALDLPSGGPNGYHEWLCPETVPTLTQMLMPEDKPLRLLLVEMLERIAGSEATLGLANRAVYDLSPEVREAAVSALKRRADTAMARPTFLQALQYPWPPAAEHAAEALVNLQDVEAVPALKPLLLQPDPTVAQQVPTASRPVVREVVRMNHLSNCVTCHAPSLSQDEPVRGLVPTPGQPVPPTFQPQYYSRNDGLFVRADVTYLRQDFSVPQPVAQPNNWPAFQRYDYLVRTRPATDEEWLARLATTEGKAYPQREAIQFALRELTDFR